MGKKKLSKFEEYMLKFYKLAGKEPPKDKKNLTIYFGGQRKDRQGGARLAEGRPMANASIRNPYYERPKQNQRPQAPAPAPPPPPARPPAEPIYQPQEEIIEELPEPDINIENPYGVDQNPFAITNPGKKRIRGGIGQFAKKKPNRGMTVKSKLINV